MPSQLSRPHVEDDHGVGVEVVPCRRKTGRSGAGLVTAACRSPLSGSMATVVQTEPPPTGMPVGFFQVSDPGSPGLGTVLKRQTGDPSERRNAPTHPCRLFSLPAGPMRTRSSKMTGAIVKVSPSATDAT